MADVKVVENVYIVYSQLFMQIEQAEYPTTSQRLQILQFVLTNACLHVAT